MPVGAGHVALSDQIAVGEKHRRLGFVGLDARGVNRHHVRPVEEVGDAAEAFGLALRAIGRAGAVEAHQLGIGGGIDDGLDGKLERPVRRLRNGQPFGRGQETFARQRPAVERERAQLQLLAVEDQRRRRAAAVRLEPELGADRGCGRIERHVEIDGFDEPVRRAVILEADGTRFFGAHDRVDVEVLPDN